MTSIESSDSFDDSTESRRDVVHTPRNVWQELKGGRHKKAKQVSRRQEMKGLTKVMRKTEIGRTFFGEAGLQDEEREEEEGKGASEKPQIPCRHSLTSPPREWDQSEVLVCANEKDGEGLSA